MSEFLLAQLEGRYPQTFQRFGENRPLDWAINGKLKVQEQFKYAATELGLDVPLNKWTKNPTKLRLALGLVDCFASSFGASADSIVIDELQEITNPSVRQVHGFTGNHDKTFAGTLHPIGEDGTIVPGAIRKLLRISKGVINGIPVLGDVSLLEIKKVNAVFIVTLNVPGLPEWNFKFIPTEAQSYFSDSVGFDLTVADKKFPCASVFSGVHDLVPTCSENCLHCLVNRGDGLMTEADKSQNKKVFESMFNFIINHKQSIYGSTLSGGSAKSADAGFGHNFGWALEELDRQLTEIQTNYGKKIQMKLQLEFILPKDKTSWKGIIDTIYTYVEKGWQINVAINLETLRDDLRLLFLRGENKSATTIDDLIEFARQLRAIVGEDFMVNTLVMSGMNPLEDEMPDDDNLAAELESILRLRKAGIRVDMIPVKADIRKDDKDPIRLEAFPPINVLYLFLQKVALAKINEGFDDDFGCDGGCSLCNPAQSIKKFVQTAEKNGENIPILLEPLLKLTGEKFRILFTALFQNGKRSNVKVMLQS